MYMSEISKFKISDLKAKKNDHFMYYEACVSYKETPCIIYVAVLFKFFLVKKILGHINQSKISCVCYMFYSS